MIKKFTEKQYQAIAKAGDKAANEYFGLVDSRVDFEELLRKEAPNQDNDFYPEFNLYNQEIMAIADQLTRDWAHEQFVKKEKKYYWRHKKTDKRGNRWYLSKQSGLWPLNAKEKYKAYPFTESEIRSWGYDVDMFDKEEAE